MTRHDQALERSQQFLINEMQRQGRNWQVPALRRQPAKPVSILQRIFGK